MEKAILFEPQLLADVERKSPELYEYYRNCPLSTFEFANYGIKDYQMYIRKEILELLEYYKKDKELNIQGIIGALQAGYFCGQHDYLSKHPGPYTKMLESTLAMSNIINTCLKYPAYTIESLLNADNFDYRNGIPYNKLTYKEAQYFVAWNTIFDRYEIWNSFFVKLKAEKKSGKWYEIDDEAVWGFPELN